MDVAREDRIEELFDQALALAPAARPAFLAEACVDDPALRSELAELLANAADARVFSDRIARAIVARWTDYVLGDRARAASTAGNRGAISRHRLINLGAAVGLAVLVVAGALFGVSRWRSRAEDPIHSVAVLPAVDFSTGAAGQSLADELTTLLINGMSQVGAGSDTPRSAVLIYKGTRKSSREIGRELRVDGLVQVSVFRDDAHTRVTVNLISATAEQVVWSRSFERTLGDVPALEQEVVRAVATEVRRRARNP